MHICHRNFCRIGASGLRYDIRRGMRLSVVAGFICFNNGAVCHVSSLDSHKHFAMDDDLQGLERGRLTYDMAFSHRKPNLNNGYRFTEKQVALLEKDYRHFLRTDTETILFNDDFFNAEIAELKVLACRLEECENV